MKPKLGGNLRRAGHWILVCALILGVGLFCAGNLSAMPRAPLPPVPEQSALYHESFDEDYYAGETNSELDIPGLGVLEESWSGYALQRTGDVIPFVVPALDPTGNTNISCDVGGTLRFWIKPYWTSGSGTNVPGSTATVLELDAVNGIQSALAWSLQVSADGNTLELFSQTGTGLQEVLQAPISWQAGTSHLLAISYTPQGSTIFYVDGAVAAQGSGLPSIPLSVGQLVIGSTLAGGNAAGADFDEFCSFNPPLTDSAIALYWQMTSGQAGLGPVSDVATGQPFQPPLMPNSPADLNPVYDPDQDGGCPTNGVVRITDLAATMDASSNMVVSMDIQGGTNNGFFDLYSSTNIAGTFADSGWTWVAQVMRCNSYIFSNQPPNGAYYVLMPPTLTMGVASGNNSDGQCTLPAGLTNPMAVAAGGQFSLALLNDGTVLGWGDNTYGQTNPPAGLSNVTAIAAGQYHAVALLADGSVTNWGFYYSTPTNLCSVTNYSTNGASPPPLSNVVAIAAGINDDIALLNDGTVVTWGMTNANANYVPTNIAGVQAVGCGWANNVVLLTNGTVMAWGCDIFGQDDVPAGLSNVVAIATAPQHSLALQADGTVVAWGDGFLGDTNVPAGLSNVVSISAGGSQSMALQANGTLVGWGDAVVLQGVTANKSISCGFSHALAIRSGQLIPYITEQPSNTFSLAGGTAGFSVSVAAIGGLQYQWQFGGTNIGDATNSSFTITNAQSANVGNYAVVLSSPYGVVTSSVVSFALVLAPQIISTSPAPGPTWITYAETLSVSAYAVGTSEYPLSYAWQLNGTNLGDTLTNYSLNNRIFEDFRDIRGF